MLSATDYVMAWSIYLLGAGALLIAAWRLSRGLWRWIREPLRVALAIVVLMPAAVDEAAEHLAPAVFVIGFELLSAPEGGMGALLGVRMLLVVIFAVIAVTLVRLLWIWLVAGRGRAEGRAGTVTAPRSRRSLS